MLGAEAVVDASIVAGAIKLATNRERPDHGDGTGGFWPHGSIDYTAFQSAANRESYSSPQTKPVRQPIPALRNSAF